MASYFCVSHDFPQSSSNLVGYQNGPYLQLVSCLYLVWEIALGVSPVCVDNFTALLLLLDIHVQVYA